MPHSQIILKATGLEVETGRKETANCYRNVSWIGLLKLRRYGGTEVSLKRQKLEMRRGSLLLLRPRVYLNALLSSASL